MNNLNDHTSVKHILDNLRRRQRMLNVLRLSCYGLIFGCGIAAVVTLILVLTIDQSVWSTRWLTLWILPILAALGALAGLFAPIDQIKIARALDRAAESEDRFASAVQLANHHHHDRVMLVRDDALNKVRGTSAQTALPITAPRGLRWLPITASVLFIILLFAPKDSLEANPSPIPEVTSQQWQTLSQAFAEQLDRLPPPRDGKEQEVLEQLQQLATLLSEKPDKKDALAKIAQVRAELNRRQKKMPARDVSMRNAAKAMKSSEALKKFASQLKQGNYSRAAEELAKLAKQLEAGELKLSAMDFEAISRDFDRLSKELSNMELLQKASQACANAGSSMNRQRLSGSLADLAEALRQNAEALRQAEQMNKAMQLVDDLQRQLNECKACAGCKNGCASCQGQGSGQNPGSGTGQGQGWGNGLGNGQRSNAFVRQSDKKGGLKAGWGSAQRWNGGEMSDANDRRMPDVAATKETHGTDTSYSTVSKDERALSAQEFNELYAEMIRKAEADLELERVPIAYREYLRRYFRGITPQLDQDDEETNN